MIPHKPNLSKLALFVCPNCAHEFVVDRAYHGSRAICRGCDQSVLVNLNEREEPAEIEQPLATELPASPEPTVYATAKVDDSGLRCEKCNGRILPEYVVASEIWWADKKGSLQSPLTFVESYSRSRRCISCGCIVFQPADWLAPHDEAGFQFSSTKVNECESCGGFCEQGFLVNETGAPAAIICARRITAYEQFRINAGYANVPVSATHCFQCGKVTFVGRKWVNAEGIGGANLVGEQPI